MPAGPVFVQIRVRRPRLAHRFPLGGSPSATSVRLWPKAHQRFSTRFRAISADLGPVLARHRSVLRPDVCLAKHARYPLAAPGATAVSEFRLAVALNFIPNWAPRARMTKIGAGGVAFYEEGWGLGASKLVFVHERWHRRLCRLSADCESSAPTSAQDSERPSLRASAASSIRRPIEQTREAFPGHSTSKSCRRGLQAFDAWAGVRNGRQGIAKLSNRGRSAPHLLAAEPALSHRYPHAVGLQACQMPPARASMLRRQDQGVARSAVWARRGCCFSTVRPSHSELRRLVFDEWRAQKLLQGCPAVAPGAERRPTFDRISSIWPTNFQVWPTSGQYFQLTNTDGHRSNLRSFGPTLGNRRPAPADLLPNPSTRSNCRACVEHMLGNFGAILELARFAKG